MFKNWPLIKNSKFFSNPHETLGKLLPHKVIIFTKFHEDWTKFVDFLFMANIWMCAVFSYSDFISLLAIGRVNLLESVIEAVRAYALRVLGCCAGSLAAADLLRNRHSRWLRDWDRKFDDLRLICGPPWRRHNAVLSLYFLWLPLCLLRP